MRVSVVMPLYNAAATVARSVTSVLDQSRAADEILIIDDGSVDGSGALAQRAGGARVTIIRQENGGAASARNSGIAKATGDLVALIDADDTWHPTKLSRQIEVFERHPDVVLAASDWGWYSGARFHTGLKLPARRRGRVVRAARHNLLAIAFSMTSSTVIARRELLVRHRFDEHLITAEDRDLWIRLAASGLVWFDPDVLTIVARRDDSLSNRDIDLDCRSMLDVLRRRATIIGARERRRWEARTYARWTGRLLSAGRVSEAFPHAVERVRREYGNPRAWWVLAKCWRMMRASR